MSQRISVALALELTSTSKFLRKLDTSAFHLTLNWCSIILGFSLIAWKQWEGIPFSCTVRYVASVFLEQDTQNLRVNSQESEVPEPPTHLLEPAHFSVSPLCVLKLIVLVKSVHVLSNMAANSRQES